MKHLFTLLLVAILAPVASVSAQDTLKIKGQEKALVVRVHQLNAAGELIYSDFIDQVMGQVKLSKVERLVVKTTEDKFRLMAMDEKLKELILAFADRTFLAEVYLKENPDAFLGPEKHIEKAKDNYSTAVTLAAISYATGLVPLIDIQNQNLYWASTGVGAVLLIAAFITATNAHSEMLEYIKEKNKSKVYFGPVNNGIGVALRINR